MAFKSIQRGTTPPESPESLFGDLRNRRIQGLLAHQADVLRDYHKTATKEADVAMQLPTGSGKTLVGLLVGEWRRRTFKEKVAYFCPTVQLANQVVAQAKDYGLKPVALTGSKKKYNKADEAEYLGAEAIAVTTYSSLFNVKPFFDGAETLILDDAHAAENYVAGHWSLLITKKDHKVLFDALERRVQASRCRPLLLEHGRVPQLGQRGDRGRPKAMERLRGPRGSRLADARDGGVQGYRRGP